MQPVAALAQQHLPGRQNESRGLDRDSSISLVGTHTVCLMDIMRSLQLLKGRPATPLGMGGKEVPTSFPGNFARELGITEVGSSQNLIWPSACLFLADQFGLCFL